MAPAAVGGVPAEQPDEGGGPVVEAVEEAELEGERPSWMTKYSGSTAVTISEEMSVTRLTAPRASTGPPTRPRVTLVAVVAASVVARYMVPGARLRDQWQV